MRGNSISGYLPWDLYRRLINYLARNGESGKPLPVNAFLKAAVEEKLDRDEGE